MITSNTTSPNPSVSKICTRCKQEKPLDQFTDNKRLSSGKDARCKVCTAATQKACPSRHPEATRAYREQAGNVSLQAWRGRNKSYLKNYGKLYGKSLTGCFSVYKSSAKHRNHAFELTIEHFEEFWQKPCVYCGGAIDTIGLDRVDSAKGYTLDNVVPCCIVCNRSKLNHTKDEWLTHIRRIIEHQDRHKA